MVPWTTAIGGLEDKKKPVWGKQQTHGFLQCHPCLHHDEAVGVGYAAGADLKILPSYA